LKSNTLLKHTMELHMPHKFENNDSIELQSADGWVPAFYVDSLEASGVTLRPSPPVPALFCPCKGEHVDMWCAELQCWTEVVIEKWGTHQRAWKINGVGTHVGTASTIRPGLTWRPWTPAGKVTVNVVGQKEKCWAQRKSSSGVFQPPPWFIAEPARSAQTACHECSLGIGLRELCLGVEQSRISKGFFAKKMYWFHCDCFETQRTHGLCLASFEGKLSPHNKLALKAVLLESVTKLVSLPQQKSNEPMGVLAAACRIAVSSDIRVFQDNIFANAFQAMVSCPFTKTSLDQDNAHVHHQKPFVFQEIVEQFVGQVGFQHVRFGEFCDPSIALQFQ
jgi:hypothetical protein